MKLIHNVCGILLLAFLLLFGVVCIGAAFFEDSAMAAMVSEFLKDDIFIVRTGVVVLTVTLVYLFSFSKGKKSTYLTFNTENGSVQVNLSAASNYLGKLKKEFAAVVSLTPKLKVKGRGVDVVLKTGIKSGTRIPELSKMLQQRARECLAEDLGLEDIADVRIVIHEISGSPPPSREAADHSIIDLSEDREKKEEEEEEEDRG